MRKILLLPFCLSKEEMAKVGKMAGKNENTASGGNSRGRARSGACRRRVCRLRGERFIRFPCVGKPGRAEQVFPAADLPRRPASQQDRAQGIDEPKRRSSRGQAGGG